MKIIIQVCVHINLVGMQNVCRDRTPEVLSPFRRCQCCLNVLDDLLLVFAEAEEEAGLRPGAALMAGNTGPVGLLDPLTAAHCPHAVHTLSTISISHDSHVRFGFAHCGICHSSSPPLSFRASSSVGHRR